LRTPASAAPSFDRGFSTDLVAATLLLVLATVVRAWVRAGSGDDGPGPTMASFFDLPPVPDDPSPR
jgi:hypothetical protein